MGNDLAAEAYFRRGEIYYASAEKLNLNSRLRRCVLSKPRYDSSSKLNATFDALNVREAFWATAAGMKLGELYEQFYLDVLQAEIPKSMGSEEKSVYFAELRKQLQPLLKHSVSIYERNISMSVRLGTSNRWIDETEKRLQNLRNLIEMNERKAPVELKDVKAFQKLERERTTKAAGREYRHRW